MKGTWILAGLLVFALSAGGDRLRSETSEGDVASLRGHTRVIVSTTTNDAVARLGVQADTMTQFLIRRLTTANIEAVTLIETRPGDSLFLSVTVEALKIGPIYVYLIQATALQCAVLTASGKAALVATWDRVFYGSLGTGKARLIREGVEEAVDDFVNDWTTANKAVDAPAADPFAEPDGEKK